MLESEQRSRGTKARADLAAALIDLEREAIEAGATERTLTAIRAAHAIVDFSEMPLSPAG
ncbi:hypothetical protein AEGHOMDF_0437 [Methylobacterium soli]|nr:hypothetical protein AEGHOMDF_0437 [Methylobacterium soli]